MRILGSVSERRWFVASATAGLAVGLVAAVLAQDVVKEAKPGMANFARLGTTVACAGAIEPAQAVPAIKEMGFVSIVNLREATESGVDIDQERQTAERAGLRYIHVPFNGRTPDPAAADRFLAAITAPGAEPAFIHCASGNRAAAMWMIKRLVIDRWGLERADREAAALGLTSGTLRQFAVDYARTQGRRPDVPRP